MAFAYCNFVALRLSKGVKNSDSQIGFFVKSEKRIISIHDKKKDSRDRESMPRKYILTLTELYESNHGGGVMIIELARIAIILSTLIHFELTIFNHFGND